ncbi:hypothetical protein E5288_WYG014646 [Bos mutus]|uniref:Uncharacterized protein n=1 Tax=Bos mutus TaxID=72004 RepID=A0A6B0R741_9CETA|nr:hypothetical protein [Bos mutus]
MLRSPVLFLFFDIDERSRISDVLLVQFNSCSPSFILDDVVYSFSSKACMKALHALDNETDRIKQLEITERNVLLYIIEDINLTREEFQKWSITDIYVLNLRNKRRLSRCRQSVTVTSSSHLLGTKLDTRSSRLSAQTAPTTGSSADVGDKTTGSRASVFRVLPRPREFINQTPDTLSIVSTHDAEAPGQPGSPHQCAGLVFQHRVRHSPSRRRTR